LADIRFWTAAAATLRCRGLALGFAAIVQPRLEFPRRARVVVAGRAVLSRGASRS
jgi:hypothetical protein